MKLTTKLLVHILVSLAVVLVPLSIYQVYSLLKESYQESYDENLRVIRSFSSPVAEALWSLDNSYMKQLVTSIVLSEAITRVEVYDEDLRVFASAGKELNTEALVNDREQKIMSSSDLFRLQSGLPVFSEENYGAGARLALPVYSVQGADSTPAFRGVLAIEYSLRPVNRAIFFRLLQNAILILFVTAVISVLLFQTLKRSVLSPLFSLLEAMRSLPGNRSVRLRPQLNHTREFVQIFVTFNNMVDELEQKEILINEQRKQMIQSSKMSALGEMAAGIAHEINNPLAIIVGYNHIVKELVKREPINSAEVIRNLTKIQETTDRISKIIQGLRTFSRNSTGDARKWISLKSIVENTLEFCSQRFKNHGIDLSLEPIPAVEIFCRDSQIIQVLLNLLNNAFDAIQNIPGPMWIRVGFVREDDKLLIRVTDSGPGISSEIADKIMQPFFTTKDVGKGTGLGLSISKGIVEEHGGQLLLNRSTVHTQFVIEFPPHLFRDMDAPITLVS